MSAFIAGSMAQLIKLILIFVKTRSLRLDALRTAGGWPSSHSALVSALAFAVGFTDGFDAPYAMVAVGLGLIVLIDAATLRREVGEHAKLLNRIVSHLNNVGEEARLEARRLEEKVGHRRREVVAGVILGAMVAFAVCYHWDFWK